MSIKITAPVEFTGEQVYGPHVIQFVDGVAEVEDLAVGVEMYMREHGYGLEYLELPDVAPEPVTFVPEVKPEPNAEPNTEPNTEPVLVGETGPELVELPKGARVTRVRKPKAE